MYVDHATGRQVDCPDPAAGLYVIDRRCSPNTNTTNNGGTSSCPAAAHSSSDDGILRVVVPPDCVAVQVGECTQIVTGGAVQATPHCVRACRLRCDDVDGSASSSSRSCIARISLPCFVDTVPGFCLRMPAGCTREQVLAADCTNKVPPLGARWQGDDMTFGSFLQTTFATYYDWKP